MEEKEVLEAGWLKIEISAWRRGFLWLGLGWPPTGKGNRALAREVKRKSMAKRRKGG